MEINVELIFLLVQAIITAILGVFTKDSILPSKWVPIQNVVIGIISGIVALGFDLFANAPIAIVTCLAISLGVGGGYDAIRIKDK